MQFRAKIITFAVVLALCAIACATLTLLLARGINQGMQKVTRAEDQLALYLTMESNMNALLRLEITAIAAPSPQVFARLREANAAVREDIATIREIVLADTQTDAEDSQVDLERLEQIEDVLNDVETTFAQTLPEPDVLDTTSLITTPLALIESLDQRLKPLVDLAIASKAARVVLARNAIARLTEQSARFGTAFGFLTLLAAVTGVTILLAAFMRPFNALLEGAARLAQGDLSFRIPDAQSDELGRLSNDFNVMASQLEHSDKALRAEEEELQKRVAARTTELEEANALLADEDATRRRFLADVSHELRTPLTVIRGEAEVALRAQDEALSADAREALHSVVQQSEHMARLVDDLFFVARREAGEAPLATRQIEIGPQLRRTLADAGQLAPDKVLVLTGDDAALSAQVNADPGRLHQLMMVLLDNAQRYSPPGSEVRVETAVIGSDVHISVRDQGIGIPAEDLPHVFDRYVRGSNALPGGTGLGLPVAKAIAEAHDAQLTVESTSDAGTCVTLTLAIANPEEAL
ncbi:MAG: ATP-binding protein [Pseudomonadota bacterium]